MRAPLSELELRAPWSRLRMVRDFDMAPPAVRLVVESAARAMQSREYVRLRCSFDAKRCAANDIND
ncbi:hypothetical protein GSH05_34330 [Burkholderia pseudomallei]|uniref:hypothetical protein n=1 Tax=Burkholderia pseudomallei TaxID=28450 RepID=UPI001940229E|nr:hypothetical protein [Burkholderia pseudomallei]MBM5656483.1 hypothetical protein [Burkholderia pseudomallei]